MALNWAMLEDDRLPVPLPHEMTLTTIETGGELTLVIPDAPPTGASSSGGKGGSKKLKETGQIWLTDQRLIFVGPSSSAIESLSVPLPQILSTKFEQPTFGANYLAFDIAPSPDGGLVRGTRAEIRVRDQALFGFVNVLEKTRERAVYMRREQAANDEADGLPAYTSHGPPGAASSSSSSSGPPYVPPPQTPSDAPPGYDA